jgi:sulfur-carrier protein
MANVTVRYWAAAKQAAGVAEETFDADTLAGAIAAALARRGHDPRLRAVLDRSSFLVDGSAVGRGGTEDVVLPEAAVIEVLPPFAGG